METSVASSVNGEVMIVGANNIILHLCSTKTLGDHKLLYNIGTSSSMTEVHPLLWESSTTI